MRERRSPTRRSRSQNVHGWCGSRVVVPMRSPRKLNSRRVARLDRSKLAAVSAARMRMPLARQLLSSPAWAASLPSAHGHDSAENRDEHSIRCRSRSFGREAQAVPIILDAQRSPSSSGSIGASSPQSTRVAACARGDRERTRRQRATAATESDRGDRERPRRQRAHAATESTRGDRARPRRASAPAASERAPRHWQDVRPLHSPRAARRPCAWRRAHGPPADELDCLGRFRLERART